VHVKKVTGNLECSSNGAAGGRLDADSPPTVALEDFSLDGDAQTDSPALPNLTRESGVASQVIHGGVCPRSKPAVWTGRKQKLL
jgi:hypothetical protein